MSLFRTAVFRTTVAHLNDLPPDSVREVAFAGRSNAGKSSALNTLTRQNALARVSKTPGRTQQLVFFEVVPEHYLVDLPGYGYAKVPLEMKAHWQGFLDRYFRTREALRGLVVVMSKRSSGRTSMDGGASRDSQVWRDGAVADQKLRSSRSVER